MANLARIAFFSVTLLAATVHSQDSIAFSVDTFTENPPALTYQGGAHIPTNFTFLRFTATTIYDGLIDPRPWSAGRVVFSPTILFSQRSTSRQASFETTLTFNMKRAENGAAEGIAFFIAPVGSTIPIDGDGANLGIFPSSGTADSLFAIEFDNYVNYGWDPDFPHIGIDINSRNSTATARFDSALGQAVTARIAYNATSKMISVDANTATLSYEFDLSSILPAQVQVGVSASTGQIVDELGLFDLLSWSFKSTLVNVTSTN